MNTVNPPNRKKHSIVSRIFILLMFVICLQAFLSLNTILLTDIASTVESYSYNTFTRTVTNRKGNLENFMSASWGNISDISLAISQEYALLLEDNESLTEKEKVVFLRNSVDPLVRMMTTAGTTGGFVILDDGEDMTYSYSSVYLKTYDNLSQVVNWDNLMLARGPAEVSKEFGFSLVTNWSYGFQLNEETFPILNTPMEATEITKSLEHLDYWHISPDITNENLTVLTCSVPFFDPDGNAVGVVGVEISQEYLFHFLPDTEFADTGSYGYIFANVTPDTAFTPTLLNSTLQSTIFSVGEPVELSNLDLQSQFLESTPMLAPFPDLTLCVYYDTLELYDNNSPYQSHTMWLVGIVDNQNMISFTEAFWTSITIMLVVSLGAGVLVSYFVGLQVAKPILNLSKVVSSYDIHEKIHFKPSNIQEIDELSSVIEQMQENILRSAHRTDQILERLNIGVGSFEYEKGSSCVTVSGAVYKMLQLQAYQGVPIPQDVFFQQLHVLKSDPIDEVPNTYAMGINPTFYYKVEEFEQDEVLLGVIEDSTKTVEDLKVLNYERNYDLLTGILNRRAFHQKVADVVKHGNLKVAGFVMFDLDNLKYVNDTFGHDSGDVYIKTAATTMYSSLHKYGVVGRMSGDEFYAFLYGFNDKNQVLSCLNALYQQFDAEPISLPNATEYKIRVSGGIAWYGEDSLDLDELQKYADFAMYKGKHTQKGELRQFDRELYIQESFMLSGKAELDRILDNDLMNFVFQPIIDVATGTIYGYEALMRPDSETLSTPLKLLQLATLEGKLWKVEKNALFKTFALYKEHNDLFQNARLFINSIPSENLTDDEYAQLQEMYQAYMPNIVIEITEQEQQNDMFIQTKLEKLHHLKLDIALDDYGSGYANDIGLIKMKPDIVKIDRSLISNVHVDPSRQTIVHKIIAFCREQNICVLGEGIETEQELDYLVKAGIQLAQGYYISRPMPLPTFQTRDIKEKLEEIQQEIQKEL